LSATRICASPSDGPQIPPTSSGNPSGPVTGLPAFCRFVYPVVQAVTCHGSVFVVEPSCRVAARFNHCIPWPVGNEMPPNKITAFSVVRVFPDVMFEGVTGYSNDSELRSSIRNWNGFV